MKVAFNLPESASVNKIIPKSKFYEKLKVNKLLKNEFVQNVQRIMWLYKISEESINISKTTDVVEIEIIQIEVKERSPSITILQHIASAIPYPILFIIIGQFKTYYAITVSTSESKNKVLTSEIFNSDEFEFVALNLEKLLQKIVRCFLDNQYAVISDIEHAVNSHMQYKILQEKLGVVERKINSQKQFNKKIELNRLANEIRKQLKEIERV